ncbi:EF-hand domain-containing protein [Streptomyces sp. CJ_13]|uniref:EF-hand domain-containing protein n=1 Tax=Streptomyces sp. CJ_13 TaxID=2724943 RepID=UPI002029E1E6|nr:EF-hand domain-containing protein [Streptomyces sp. CJ_13]
MCQSPASLRSARGTSASARSVFGPAVMEVNVTTPAHFESAVMAIADAVMNALDTNGDGVLSLEEYVRLYDTLGVPKDLSAQAFTRLDLDGDGVISFEEYRTAIVEFYLSADPQAAGNYLLGPVGTSV